MASFVWPALGGSAGGTVTSVGLTDASTIPIFGVTGTPVVSSGTLTLTLATQAKNLVFAGPATGANAQPNFRSLVVADLPTAIPLANLATQANNTILGNISGSSATPLALTVAQINTVLPVFTSSLNGLAPLSGGGTANFLRADGTWAAPPGATSGTVTSVGLADSTNIFNVTGTPVTSTGTLTLASLKSQTQNTFLAAPNGSSGAPTFRTIVAADVPTLNQNTTGTAANITASSNSTLTTLSALSLPASQVTGLTSGTVTSVALADLSTSAIYTVTGSPVTSNGTLNLTLKTQTAATVFAGPATGAAAQPTFRALAAGDIPARQVVIGTAQTTNGTTTSATYAAPSNTVSVTIVPTVTGFYKVTATNIIMFGSIAGHSFSSRIVVTAGSPTTNIIGQINVDETSGFGTGFNFTYNFFGVYTLTASVTYTFQLQGQIDAGTLTFAFGTLNGFLIAEQM